MQHAKIISAQRSMLRTVQIDTSSKKLAEDLINWCLAQQASYGNEKFITTWKRWVLLIENIKITFSEDSKASLSLASLLLWVAHTPCWTDISKFSRLQLLTIKYLVFIFQDEKID